MKKLAILLAFTTFLLTGCGESHTYSGVLKRTGLGGAEGKVKITIEKQAEGEATITIKNDGVNPPGLFLTECLYPIKAQLADSSTIGKPTWNPANCYMKDESASLTGYFTIDEKQMEMKVVTELATNNENRFEFIGFEK